MLVVLGAIASPGFALLPILFSATTIYAGCNGDVSRIHARCCYLSQPVDVRAGELQNLRRRIRLESPPTRYQSALCRIFAGARPGRRCGASLVSGGVEPQRRAGTGRAQAISLGFGIAFAQRSFNTNSLKFQNQWDGDIFNASASTGENFNRASGFVPTLSAGLQWQVESAETRSRLSIGAGAFHLNRPKLGFRNDQQPNLPIRLALHLQSAYQINQTLDIVAFAVAQSMHKSREIVAGGGVRQVLTTGPGNETAVQVSLAMRLGDAFIPAVQFERNEWTVGVSYDLNTSDFNVATGRRGGFEIAAVYRKIPVPPVKVFKSCPIF